MNEIQTVQKCGMGNYITKTLAFACIQKSQYSPSPTISNCSLALIRFICLHTLLGLSFCGLFHLLHIGREGETFVWRGGESEGMWPCVEVYWLVSNQLIIYFRISFCYILNSVILLLLLLLFHLCSLVCGFSQDISQVAETNAVWD